MLARKHYHLWHAHRAWATNANMDAQAHAAAALQLDPESAVARVVLGLASDPVTAARLWKEATETLPAHPYGHLLLGNQLRLQNSLNAARHELAFETSSLEDLQRWTLDTFGQAPQARIDIGDGLDLGMITGFYPAKDGTRWTKSTAIVHKLSPNQFLSIRLRSLRPSGAPQAQLRVLVNGQLLDTITVGADWQTATFTLPEQLQTRGEPISVTLETPTFRPRDYNRASPDNRALGVEVDWVATTAERGTP